MRRLAGITVLFVAATAFAADPTTLTGSWSLHQSIAGNDSDQQCNFTQDGSKLTGTCNSDGNNLEITGSVENNKAMWKYDTEYNGGALTAKYTAPLNDPKKITGTVDVDPYGVS